MNYRGKLSGAALVALAVLAGPASAQWVRMDAPPQRGLLITTGAPGELMTATTSTARGNVASGTWQAGVAQLEFSKLVPSPDAHNVIYGLRRDKQPLWRSVDSGYTWHELKTGGAAHVLAEFSAGSFASGTMFGIGELDRALYSSRDGGFSWIWHHGAMDPRELTCELGPSKTLYNVLAHPTRTALVFAIVACGIARSSDGGFTWQLVKRPRDAPTFNSSGKLSISPADGTLYNFESRSLWRSRDFGFSWEERGFVPGGDVQPDPFAIDVLWATYWKSVDAGRTWSVALAPLRTLGGTVPTLLFPSPGEIVAVEPSGYAYRWNETQGWLAFAPTGAASALPRAFVARDDGGSVFLGPPEYHTFGVFTADLYVKNPGSRWNNVGPHQVYSLARDVARDVVYGIAASGGLVNLSVRTSSLVRFDPEGSRQELARVEGACTLLAVAPASSPDALVSCDNGLGIWSPSSGLRYFPSLPAGEVPLAAAWTADNVVTLVTSQFVYRNYERVSPFDANAESPISLAVHPADSRRLFMAGRSGIRHSTDGGGTWSSFELGARIPSAHLSATSHALYAASAEGMFRCDGYHCEGAATPTRADLVELLSPAQDRFFLTVDSAELESLTAHGWIRTGERIGAYRDALPDMKELRRFVGTPGFGPATHFFAPDGSSEVESVVSQHAWIEERSGASYIFGLTGEGVCAAGTPVWRLYNNGAAQGKTVNHRYAVRPEIRDAMVARGWIDEGVRFCAPE